MNVVGIRIMMLAACATIVGCGKQASSDELNKALLYEITNTLKLDWPGGLTNAQIASYRYSTIFEGGHTTVYVQRIETDSVGAEQIWNLVQTNKLLFSMGFKPVPDPHAEKYASWWRPEDFNDCRIFMAGKDSTNGTTSLNGTIARTPTNYIIFLQLHIVQK
jgi:hypothetical protein